MNFISHINAFFSYVKTDRRLTCTHVGLYMALFQCWNYNRFQNSFPIGREEVMALSGIGSKNTYHKTIKDLHAFGYIYFRTSLSKFHKSTVQIAKLKNGNYESDKQQLELFSSVPQQKNPPDNQENNAGKTVSHSVHIKDWHGTKNDIVPVPQLTATGTNIDTVPVPEVGPLIKHKHINSKQEREENSLTQTIFFKNKNLQESINAFCAAAKNGTYTLSIHSGPDNQVSLKPVVVFQKPSLEEVLQFFAGRNYPPTEARKFFSHYQSNGWLVAGKVPMQDWQSSADKWMLNEPNFRAIKNSPDKGKQNPHLFDPSTTKDYSQPL